MRWPGTAGQAQGHETDPEGAEGALSSTMAGDLRDTVIDRWYTRLAGNTSARRNHWQTKIVYYRAAADLLTAQPGQPLTWKSVVAAARPHGCRSTFYEVAGAHARHRMTDDLIKDGQPDSVQLALRFQRTEPVDRLVDETKVWSYWPYRAQLLTTLRTPGLSLADRKEAQEASLTAWAQRYPALAAALGHCPPACAVEDLTVLAQGQIAAFRAASLLSEVLRTTAGATAG